MTERPRYRITRAAYDVITVFGSLNAEAVPGQVITAVLGDRGWTESNVRNQLTRLVERDLLSREQSGRYSVFTMTPQLLRNFEVLRSSAPRPVFDGSFRALIHSVPERSRTLRDRLVYVARLQGFHALRPGVLIGTEDTVDEVLQGIGPLDDDSWLIATRIVPASSREATRMAEIAFDLRRVRADIAGLGTRLACLQDAEPLPPQARYYDPHFDMAQKLLDVPRVPAGLIVGTLPDEQLGAMMGALNTVYWKRYWPHIRRVVAAQPSAALVRYLPDPAPTSLAEGP